jgi:hypothetical protein
MESAMVRGYKRTPQAIDRYVTSKQAVVRWDKSILSRRLEEIVTRRIVTEGNKAVERN